MEDDEPRDFWGFTKSYSAMNLRRVVRKSSRNYLVQLVLALLLYFYVIPAFTSGFRRSPGIMSRFSFSSNSNHNQQQISAPKLPTQESVPFSEMSVGRNGEDAHPSAAKQRPDIAHAAPEKHQDKQENSKIVQPKTQPHAVEVKSVKESAPAAPKEPKAAAVNPQEPALGPGPPPAKKIAYIKPKLHEKARTCNPDICRQPDCYCGGTGVPGGYQPQVFPQLVLLTFDDAVNDLNKHIFTDIFALGLKNPNGCPIRATFNVAHKWTDYSLVQNLYAAGHEIAVHTITHSPGGDQFTDDKWMKEIIGQKNNLIKYGGIRKEDIRGFRAPYLLAGGDKMFKVLYEGNFSYDASLYIFQNNPPNFPNTMDYKMATPCGLDKTVCPRNSYPGFWEIPLVSLDASSGEKCAMLDGCSQLNTSEGVKKMLYDNFLRHYKSNRAPFGLFMHSLPWFTIKHQKQGFENFLKEINKLEDVWVVTAWQMIQWMRRPTPRFQIHKFAPFNCSYPERPSRCLKPKNCQCKDKVGYKFMKTCFKCPDNYPWVDKTGL